MRNKFLAVVVAIIMSFSASADCYQIEFCKSSAVGVKVTKADFVNTIVSAGAEYISGVGSASYCYTAQNALQLGYNYDAGNFSITLTDAGQVIPTSVEIVAKRFNSEGDNIKLQYSTSDVINSTSSVLGMQSLPADYETLLFNVVDGLFISKVKAFRISSTAKAYIKSIKVNYSHEGGKIDAKSEAEAVSAVSYGSGISIKAVGRCADVAIFDASGSEMYRLTLDDDTKYIELPAGFYVVSSGGYRQKIIVR